MTGYEQFIAVVLATFLAIFVLLGIVVLILAIKLIVAIRRLTQKAEKLTDKAGHITEFFQHASGPMAMARGLSFVTDILFRKNAKTKRKG